MSEVQFICSDMIFVDQVWTDVHRFTFIQSQQTNICQKPAVEQSYITLPKSGVEKRFVIFLKEIYYAKQKKKNSNIVKYNYYTF